MRLIITNNVAQWAANYIKNKINSNIAKRNFVLGLPTGGTSESMYKSLVSYYKNGTLSFNDVTTFNMDEYINLTEDHPQSYHSFMNNNLFLHVDIKKENINIPNGNARDVKEECALYEQKILQAGGIDLFIGGLGNNGHIAFNEPYSSLSSKTRDKELNSETILANARFFNNDVNFVPKTAITVGIDTIMSASEVLILVTGSNKAVALSHIVDGSVSHVFPATILQMHKKAIIVANEDACLELKVKTYRYFKELEDEFSIFSNSI